jgi:hypothetical protein
MAETREDGPGEIKQEVVDVAELAVNGISEEIEEVHVAEDVHDASMEKGVCEELPDVRGFGVEHEVFCERTEEKSTLGLLT